MLFPNMSQLLLPFLLLLLLASFYDISSSPPPSQPDRFLKSTTSTSLRQQSPQQYLELTQPLPSDHHLTPSCTHPLLHHSFADTMGHPPFSVLYSPPSDCPHPWSHVILQIDATCQGEQYDRILAVWLAGSEILRSSTAEPTASGIFWKVRKDVTRYSSLFQQSNLTLSIMLENLVNDDFTGVYQVNATLFFYSGNSIRNRKSPDLYEQPADLIIPISDDGSDGFWFRIQNQSDVHSKNIELPRNAYRIVLELYASFHGDDEFWYSNPPNTYMEANHLNTNRGNGALRVIFVRIDGIDVAYEIPFPVVFTGGINPLLWEPVVAIGAFDLPSYDFELTPFLGSLLVGKRHSFEIGVSNANQFWLIDANLHLWLDHESSNVAANMVAHNFPRIQPSWKWEFDKLDGSFEVEAKRKSQTLGWVASSYGNLTTSISRKIKFKNSIKFKENGTYKMVEQKVKVKTEVRVEEAGSGKVVSRTTLKRKYPLRLITSTVPRLEEADTYYMTTNVSMSWKERASNSESSGFVLNSQEGEGWMVVKDHSVLSGGAETRQSFKHVDDTMCFSRDIEASAGQLLKDESSSVCPSLLSKAVDILLRRSW